MRKRVLIPIGVLLGVVILTTVIGLYTSKEAGKTCASYQNDTTYTAEKNRSYGGILERLRSYDAHKLRSVFSDVQSNYDVIPEGYSGLPDSIGYVERFYLSGQPHSRGWFAFFDHRTSNMIPVGEWRYYDVSGREYKRFYPFHHGGDSLHWKWKLIKRTSTISSEWWHEACIDFFSKCLHGELIGKAYDALPSYRRTKVFTQTGFFSRMF